jgi:hypothetical protein
MPGSGNYVKPKSQAELGHAILKLIRASQPSQPVRSR